MGTFAGFSTSIFSTNNTKKQNAVEDDGGFYKYTDAKFASSEESALDEIANWETWPELTESMAGTVLSGNYKVTRSMYLSADLTKPGIEIPEAKTLRLYIVRGATLTIKGGDARGRIGGGAGIKTNISASLKLYGYGKLVANGGNAANGANGKNANGVSVAYVSASEDTTTGLRVYSPGEGGNGGGGAGFAVGFLVIDKDGAVEFINVAKLKNGFKKQFHSVIRGFIYC